MKNIVLCIVILVSFGQYRIFPQNGRDRSSKDPRAATRYVIIDNHLDPPIDLTDSEGRFVEILLADKSFGKDNLIDVFRLISKRFPKPELLFVNVFTSLEYIQTPEERDLGGMSDSPSAVSTKSRKIGPPSLLGNRATFVRRVDGSVRLIINSRNGESEVMVFK